MSNILFDGKYVALDCRYPKLPKLRNFKVMFNLKEEKLLGIVDESKYDSFEVFWIKFLSLQAMWIISDYYRDPKNPKRAARFYANETNDPHFHARGITQREKVAFTSTFSSITFEDITSMVTMADNAARSGKKELISEVEKVSLGEI